MTTDSQQAASPPPPAGFWKIRHAVIGLGILAVVVIVMRACGNGEAGPQTRAQADRPRQAIVVQIPASQLPTPPPPVMPPQAGYGYAPPPPVAWPQAPVAADDNPWAVQSRPRDSGQYGSRRWGQPQPRPPEYVQPSTGAQYRPLEPESTARAPRAPAAQQPIPAYRPVAPYDRLSGSSFGTPSYPYGGAYPGYYGPGLYGVPGGVYAPGWPGVGPGIGWPGYW